MRKQFAQYVQTLANFLQSPLSILVFIDFPMHAVNVRHNVQSCRHTFLFIDAVEHVRVPYKLNELCSNV